MKFYLRIAVLSLGLLGSCWGQIWADFQTTKGDFRVYLDYVNAPLAVANFIQLAGKPDDILETPAGVPVLGTPQHFLRYYSPTAESDVQRPRLQVARIEPTPTMRGFYAIFQGSLYIGGVEGYALTSYHADITGEDRIRLQQVSPDPHNPKYRITLRYPRNWIDARDGRVKAAPMFANMKIHSVERGQRFFAGTMTNNPRETPGYYFQDEVARIAGDPFFASPFGTAGWLAMDHRGKNENGSRFFITSVPYPSLDGDYTAFGRVLSGLDVVEQITDVPTIGVVPEQDMYLLGITINRVGILANAFMEGFHQDFLPGPIEELPLAIDRTNGAFDLVTALRPQTQNALYSSVDLGSYFFDEIRAQSPFALEEARFDRSQFPNFAPRLFFKGFATQLPEWPSAEVDWRNARLSLRTNSEGDAGTLNLQFSGDGISGNYQINMIVEQTEGGLDPVTYTDDSLGSGTFVATYDSSEGPFKGVLRITDSSGPLNTEELTLHFDSRRKADVPRTDPNSLTLRFDSRTTDPEATFLSYSGIFQGSF